MEFPYELSKEGCASKDTGNICDEGTNALVSEEKREPMGGENRTEDLSTSTLYSRKRKLKLEKYPYANFLSRISLSPRRNEDQNNMLSETGTKQSFFDPQLFPSNFWPLRIQNINYSCQTFSQNFVGLVDIESSHNTSVQYLCPLNSKQKRQKLWKEIACDDVTKFPRTTARVSTKSLSHSLEGFTQTVFARMCDVYQPTKVGSGKSEDSTNIKDPQIIISSHDQSLFLEKLKVCVDLVVSKVLHKWADTVQKRQSKDGSTFVLKQDVGTWRDMLFLLSECENNSLQNYNFDELSGMEYKEWRKKGFVGNAALKKMAAEIDN